VPIGPGSPAASSACVEPAMELEAVSVMWFEFSWFEGFKRGCLVFLFSEYQSAASSIKAGLEL
jgi:hypothetical protein